MLTSWMTKKDDGDHVIVTSKCPITGKDHSVRYPKNGFNKWEGGELIQVALPLISADDREFLISGISPEGCKQIFGEEL